MGRLIKDRRGIALAYPIIFLMLMSCAGLVLDIGRGHMVKAKMQTIVDSSSLAGASTAEYQSDLTLETGADGSISVKEVNSRLKIADPEKANDKAMLAAVENGATSGFWDKVMAKFDGLKTNTNLGEDETGWSGQVSGDAKYKTQARVKLVPGFLKFLGSDEVIVYTDSDAEAFLDTTKEGDNGS